MFRRTVCALRQRLRRCRNKTVRLRAVPSPENQREDNGGEGAIKSRSGTINAGGDETNDEGGEGNHEEESYLYGGPDYNTDFFTYRNKADAMRPATARPCDTMSF